MKGHSYLACALTQVGKPFGYEVHREREQLC